MISTVKSAFVNFSLAIKVTQNNEDGREGYSIIVKGEDGELWKEIEIFEVEDRGNVEVRVVSSFKPSLSEK